jgi:hypothetical protein
MCIQGLGPFSPPSFLNCNGRALGTVVTLHSLGNDDKKNVSTFSTDTHRLLVLFSNIFHLCLVESVVVAPEDTEG